MLESDKKVTDSVFLADEVATLAYGDCLAKSMVQDAMVIYLQGDLGVGKTTLSRGFIQGLGHTGSVKSPTFTLVEPYSLNDRCVYHFDLYRLCDAEELDYMGIRDYFQGNAICLIEWPQKGDGILPMADMLIQMTPNSQGRKVECTVNSQKALLVLEKMQKMLNNINH